MSTECYDLSDNFVTVNRIVRSESLAALRNGSASTATSHKSLLSPNPTKDIVVVRFSEELDPTSPVTIQVINAVGSVLKQSIATGVQSAVSVSDLPNGIYFARIYQNEHREMIKFVKN
ncbi:MAG: T9SS type A sorting domain-containing protein [Saprospiraceae bacterium]|nr:T9SS type A sorting domain-containing protein [Saprospiraceae bacterium]